MSEQELIEAVTHFRRGILAAVRAPQGLLDGDEPCEGGKHWIRPLETRCWCGELLRIVEPLLPLPPLAGKEL